MLDWLIEWVEEWLGLEAEADEFAGAPDPSG